MKECRASRKTPLAQVLCWGILRGGVVVTLALAMSFVYAQDDYLKALEAEAAKVSPGVAEIADAPDPAEADNSNQGVSREQFEALLRDNYRGTYVFYKELPANNREEMYAEYQRGVSITDLRAKIMDRYLNR